MAVQARVHGGLIPFLLERTVRHAFRAAILIAFVGLGGVYTGLIPGGLKLLRSALNENESWVRTHTELRDNFGREPLFDQLLRLGFINLKLDTGEIQIANCNEIRARRVNPEAGSDAIGARDESIAVLRRSCDSEFGRFIRRSVAAWNDGLTVLAVRDDALRNQPCGDGSMKPKAYIPAECHRSKWSIETEIDGEWRSEGVRGLPPPSAAAFGFLAAHLLPGFGDWLRIAAPPSSERRRIAASYPADQAGGTLRIDLIGMPQRDGISVKGGQLTALQPICDVRNGAKSCTNEAKERGALAWRLEIRRQPSAPLQVGIVAAPVAWRPAKLVELQESFAEVRKSHPALELLYRGPRDETGWPPDAGEETIHSEGPLALHCVDIEEPLPPCRLALTVTPTTSGRKHGEVRILLGDKPLNETSGNESQPTDLAFQSGLETLVGVGNFDHLALAQQLARNVREGQTRIVKLSLDPALQAMALEVLRRGVGDRTDRSFENIHSRMPTEWDRDRRGGIVVIDLNTEPGAIRAAAAWPSAPSGLNQWDLSALGSWRPTRSPFAPRLWAATDRLSNPGSSFKMVTALALVQAAVDGDPAARDIIMGLNGSQFQNLLKLNPQSGSYTPDGGACGPIKKPIPNFGGAVTCAGCASGGRLGLRQALTFSINTYFSAAAVRLDREAADRQTRGTAAAQANTRPFYLSDAADRLYPGMRFDLAVDAAGGTVTGARSWAVPIDLEARKTSCPRVQRLALNAIGQAVQASPLAMASIAGSIALGRQLHPSLISGGASLASESILRNWPGPSADNEYYREMLNGLADVVARGTAAAAFNTPELRTMVPKIAGKTGTAETGTKEPNTVWFVGWMADGPVAQPGSRPQFAFACYVTHVGGTGGAVCAPLIARLIGMVADAAPRGRSR